jgi:capsular polysaccharide biosynthesis protein
MMEETTYIGDLFKIIKKYLWLILLIGIIGGLSGKMVTPPQSTTYEASSLVLIKQQLNETNTIINQTDETNRFINTASTLINTAAILKPVKKELKIKEDVNDLASRVRVTNENGSHILKITVSDTNPKKATIIVNKIADVMKSEIGKYIDVETVKVIQRSENGQELAVLQSRPKANMIMGTVIGLVVGVILSLVLSFYFKPSKGK